MAGFTNYMEQKLLEHFFGLAAYTPATNLYVAFFTTAPAEDGTGGVEVSGGAYARVAVANNSTNWSYSAGTVTNLTQIIFPTATADWGTILRVVLMSASTSGTILAISDAVSFSVTSGLEPLIDIGDLAFTLD
jgi:hypothetical protein